MVPDLHVDIADLQVDQRELLLQGLSEASGVLPAAGRLEPTYTQNRGGLLFGLNDFGVQMMM